MNHGTVDGVFTYGSIVVLDHSLIIHEAEVLAPLRHLTTGGLGGLVTTSDFSVMTTLSNATYYPRLRLGY